MPWVPIIGQFPNGLFGVASLLEGLVDRFDNMRVFAKVVESGGFTSAAARLGMSASMVSQHVKELEERLSVRLLNRTTRKVSLTETGRAYYQRCTRLRAASCASIAGRASACGISRWRSPISPRAFRQSRSS